MMIRGGHLRRVAAHKAVRQHIVGIGTATIASLHGIASWQLGMFQIEVAVRHSGLQLRIDVQHLRAVDLKAARPVIL